MRFRWTGIAVVSLLVVLAVGACSPAAAPATAVVTPPDRESTAAPTDIPTAATADAPTEAQTAASGACPQAAEGTQLFTNETAGFCVLVPAKFSAKATDAYVGSFIGPEEERDGDIAPYGWIEASDAQGKTAEESAAPAVAEVIELGGKKAEPQNITVGGEPAVMVDNLPGQDVTRKVFVVHGGTLYVMSFTPTNPDYKHFDSVQALYDAMIGSFTFTK